MIDALTHLCIEAEAGGFQVEAVWPAGRPRYLVFEIIGDTTPRGLAAAIELREMFNESAANAEALLEYLFGKRRDASPHHGSAEAISCPKDCLMQISKNMANLLAASGCDLGDEREVMRVLQRAEFGAGTIVAHSDIATELAREIRANSKKLQVS